MKYFKLLKKLGWVNSQNQIVGFAKRQPRLKNRTSKQFHKIQFLIKKHILSKTSFLPTDYLLSYRTRIMEREMSEVDCGCPIEGCCGYLKKSDLEKHYNSPFPYFRLTCGEKDNVHKIFTANHRLPLVKETNQKNLGADFPLQSEEVKIKAKKTNLTNHGGVYATGTKEVQEKTKNTKQHKYGSDHHLTVHMNQNLYNKLSKLFIEENFVDDDGFIEVEKFMIIFNCSSSSVQNFCKRYGVPYRKRPKDKWGFDNTAPAILYYFKDKETNFYKIGITNETDINQRFRLNFHRTRINILYVEYFEYGYQARDSERKKGNLFKKFNITNESWITYGFDGRKHTNGATEFYLKDVLNKDNLLLTI